MKYQAHAFRRCPCSTCRADRLANVLVVLIGAPVAVLSAWAIVVLILA